MISDTPPQTVIETVTLPTGEVIMNESKSDDAGSSNNLFYQANASVPYESMGEIDLMFSSISLHKSKPFILKDGNHEALVIGDYVFERSAQKGGRYWLVKDTKPDFVAEALLRNFILPNGPAQYVFDHLDLDQNVLVTRLKFPCIDERQPCDAPKSVYLAACQRIRFPVLARIAAAKLSLAYRECSHASPNPILLHLA